MSAFEIFLIFVVFVLLLDLILKHRRHKKIKVETTASDEFNIIDCDDILVSFAEHIPECERG